MSFLRGAAVLAAMLITLTLVLIVCFVFVGLYRVADYSVMYKTVRTPRVRISDLYPALKTGDLILFAAATNSLANSVLTQTFHSHAGVLLREGEQVYISEAGLGAEMMPSAAGDDYRTARGVDLTPLLTRLKYYTGHYYILRLSRPLDPAREEALKRTAERLHRIKYPYPTMAQIFLGVLGRRTDSRHCFQHVAHVLDCASLTPLDRAEPLAEAGFVEVCREICELDGRSLPDGYRYGGPVCVIYDIDAVAGQGPDGGDAVR